MSKIKIGIIKEGKVPIDRRVPITPFQAKLIKAEYEHVDVVCQSSDIRCFPDEDYISEGIEVVDDVSDCDILFGVKEVPIPDLIEGKTYFFFSHTIKEQEYNRDLLREILKKKIDLIDYECLTNSEGQRIIAFGRYAGIVGAYNGIWTYGQRYNLFNIRRSKDCFDLEDLKTEFPKVKLPPVKIVLTGGGRVARGAMEVLYGMGVRKVTPSKLLTESNDEPEFAQLSSRDYHVHAEGDEFNRAEFFQYPEKYKSTFLDYAHEADILIAAAYWDPNAPVLFTRHDVLKKDFNIKVIADITCDIEGSIPSTKQPSTIEDPIYDYDPTTDQVAPALAEEGNITVMAVDNLPCELPRDASTDFGTELINNVLPNLLGKEDRDDTIKRATITKKGALTEKYNYLQGFVDEE
ncbi:MAG: NAD(P)-dependent oxidoreductase [Bacteroidota bacterium]